MGYCQTPDVSEYVGRESVFVQLYSAALESRNDLLEHHGTQGVVCSYL